MESSDDSFAWANTSSASEDSDKVVEEIVNNKQDSFESDVDYKKKLHKKLFNESEGSETKIKRELLNSMKKELDNGEESNHDNTGNTRNHTKKKKSKKQLSMHIKEELDSVIPIKYESSPESLHNIKSQGDNVSVLHDEGHRIVENEGDVVQDEVKAKRKKKKTKKHSLEHEQSSDDTTSFIIEDKFSAEETVVESRPTKRKLLSNSIHENGEIEHTTSKKKKKKDNNNDDFREELESHNLNTNKTNNNKSLKISDYIQFEEESDSQNVEISDTPHNDTSMTAGIKRFIKKKSYLHPVSCSQVQPMITEDDEVWVLKCPTEIETDSLSGNDLILDSKCKLKVANQTYVGKLETKQQRLPILQFDHNKAIIKNIVSNGTIMLHRRVPKAHIVYDNLMVNNQTDFIPLPETKCRHPLFGHNYKKAMKLSSSVKARLKDTSIEANSPAGVKKKKKKKYRQDEEEDEEPARSDKLRKRKLAASPAAAVEPYTEENEVPMRKKRRRKQESKTLDTWDSERAIEENLFNF